MADQYSNTEVIDGVLIKIILNKTNKRRYVGGKGGSKTPISVSAS